LKKRLDPFDFAWNMEQKVSVFGCNGLEGAERDPNDSEENPNGVAVGALRVGFAHNPL
jgi:hypothetical protein